MTISFTRKPVDSRTGEARLPHSVIAHRREATQLVHSKRMRGESVADCFERLYGTDPVIRRDVAEQSALEAISRGVELWVIAHATGLKVSRVRELAAEYDSVESV